jgi:diaminopimelate decarboxylase
MSGYTLFPVVKMALGTRGLIMINVRNGMAVCEDIVLKDLVFKLGTPLYVYSQSVLLGKAQALLSTAVAQSQDALVCYAVKANGNVAILRLLGKAGLGADVTSGGELFLAGNAGISPQKTIFSGVGKTDAEIEMAINAGIRALHVESEAEFERIAAIAKAKQTVVNIGVRINPDIEADTHAHIRTGGKQHKFGVPIATAMSLFQRAQLNPWLKPVGVAAHIGSQIRDLAPFAKMAHFLVEVAEELRGGGIDLDYIDTGGGLGIGYGETTPDLGKWAETVAIPVAKAGFGLVLEPGRSIVGEAGTLIAEVIVVKEQGGKRFVVVNAGMSDLIRPTLYNAHHPIQLINRPTTDPLTPADVVGPICETGDYLAKDRLLPPLQAGDLLAIFDAGAYGYAMSSNYNGRLRPPEVLVDGSSYKIIRKRQSYEDLL